ncbi:MAG TPA: GNAT family N-acetyltransferase [Acidobacteriota bacterium]|jgi:GNAT superfamily N-acetyltransferase
MKKSELRIEKATEKDVPLLLQFIKELAEYEKLSHAVVATEEMVRRSLFGETPRAEAIIAYCAESPAGFALFFHNFSTFLGRAGIYLEDLYVRPPMRGKGTGRALLACLADLARERDCGRMEWAVLDWNEPAIRFYRKLGAVTLDDWKVCRLSGEALQRLAGEWDPGLPNADSGMRNAE